MKKDDSLLKLEHKLNNFTHNEIIANKFNFSKPNINMQNLPKFNKCQLEDFLEKFKKTNEEIISNKVEYNIENNSNSNSDEEADSDNKPAYIKMDLALGVLEQKKELNPSDIITESKLQEQNELNSGDKALLKFIVNK